MIVAQAMALDAATSVPLIYSASVYGRSDFGVNRLRLLTWVAALDDAIKLL